MIGFRHLRFAAWLVSASALVTTLAVTARPAHAQADDALTKARASFDRGQDLFDKGDFKAAGDAFLEAYAAKPYAAFLYNAAVCFEKLKDFEKAVELFEKYLAGEPKASDREDVEKRIKALKDEIARLKANPPADPSAEPAPQLPEVKTKGVVLIVSNPTGATIYLDDKKAGPIGVTPWAGSIEGMHNVIFELQGYQTHKAAIQPNPGKILQVEVGLAKEEYLGWLEVKSNVPGSDVYIDSKEVGAVGKTPFSGNVQPGKRTIWVVKDGYTEVTQTITIEAGRPHNLTVKLEEAPIGYVAIKADESGVGASVSLDGKRVCDKAPCRFQAPEGRHTISVARDGKKALAKKVEIVRKSETTLNVRLVDSESYWGAATVWFVLGAGFAGGGYYVSTLDPDEKDAMGMDKYSDTQKTALKVGPWVGYGLGVVCLGAVVYNLVWRDDPPYSSAKVESRDVTWVTPVIAPGYAGFSSQFTF